MSASATTDSQPAEIIPESGRAALSVVVPLLNEVESLPQLHTEITVALAALDLAGPAEIIYVDDGSTDGSARILQRLFESDPRVQVIQFRRNFR